MADGKVDLSKLSLTEILLLVGFAIMGTAMISGLSVIAGIALDGLVAAVIGAVIGLVAWWFYVVKRKADHHAR
jgi:type IV secretory pathway TrbD component